MDRILITDLGTRCIIGVRERERQEKQDVVINRNMALPNGCGGGCSRSGEPALAERETQTAG